MIALAFSLAAIAAWFWTDERRLVAPLAISAALAAAGPLAIWGVLSVTIVSVALIKAVMSLIGGQDQHRPSPEIYRKRGRLWVGGS